MKKILFFIVCLVVTTSLFALDVTMGGAIGINYGWNSGDDWDNMLDGRKQSLLMTSPTATVTDSAEIGVEVGAFWDIAVNNFFSIQPELNLVLLFVGVKDEYEIYTPTYSFISRNLTFKATFFEIPILAKFNFGTGKVKFSVFAGPSLIIMLGDLNSDADNYDFYDENDYDKKIDYYLLLGCAVGAGCSIPAGSGKFILDLRYRRTLMNYRDAFDARANTVGLRIGYGIDL